MKKTFLYVLMAAAALFTSTMSSCSDDDDTKNNEAEEAMIDDINQCILNNFVVLDGDNNFLREGLYGGHKDAADTTSFLFQVADAEAAVKFYNALMPDSLVSKVKVDGQKRTLSYTQEGKQYTMIYAPATGENIATITLPNVEGYNKYARTVQLRDHVSDNALSAAQFQEKYYVGKCYWLNNRKLPVTNYLNTSTAKYLTKSTDNQDSQNRYAVPSFCVYNDGNNALFMYIPMSGLNSERQDYVVLKKNESGEYLNSERYYALNTLTTNQCYDNIAAGGYNEFLPTTKELRLIRDNFTTFVNNYNRLNAATLPTEGLALYTNMNQILRVFSSNIEMYDVNFATCETKNGLFIKKQVKFVDFAMGNEYWKNKNSEETLKVVYIFIVPNK